MHFKMYMPCFSLVPSGCLCLIRLEGLQFEITYVAWCPISLYDFGNKANYHGFLCKQIRDRCKHSCKPYSCFLSTDWIILSSGSLSVEWQCADYGIYVTRDVLQDATLLNTLSFLAYIYIFFPKGETVWLQEKFPVPGSSNEREERNPSWTMYSTATSALALFRCS